MKKTFILLFSLLVGKLIQAQPPGIKWQNIYYGENPGKNKIITTDKKHYMIGCDIVQGTSFQISISKIDTSGLLIWQKFFGGSQAEFFGGISETSDQGFIIIGTTQSNDGDVSGNHGYKDIWVIKIDRNGIIEWQKCLGGSDEDDGNYIEQTKDGGYILTGLSNSTDGDMPGNHGPSDIFAAKLSENGTTEWTEGIGGSGTERGIVIRQLSDNNYLLGATTNSSDGDINGNHSIGDDMALIKLDDSGKIIFSNCYGSPGDDNLYNALEDKDGNYVIGGSVGGEGGDVSGNHIGYASQDGWLAKVNSKGDLLWQRCIGGTRRDWITDFVLTQDNSYLITGSAASLDGDFQANKGGSDVFVAKYNAIENKIEWQKNLGGSALDYGSSIQYLSDREYIFLANTASTNGDVENHPTSSNVLWLVRLANANTIIGTTYYDKNSNFIKDNDEYFIDAATINITDANNLKQTKPYSGKFTIDVDTGNFRIQAFSTKPYYVFAPSSIDTSFSTYFNTDSVSFGLQPMPGKKDLSITMIPNFWARIGDNLQYKILYQNPGTVTSTGGSILLIKDSNLTLISASPNFSSQHGDTLSWNYTTIGPLEFKEILVNFKVGIPPKVMLGTKLTSVAFINGFGDDLTPGDDTSTLTQIVVGAFDPNNKVENHAGTITKSSVAKGEWLTYTIRFQNTGTDTAFNINVRDTLDGRLEWSTLEIVDASYSYQLYIDDGNKCSWYFNNIFLPDSNVNEGASHGYLVYRIKPKTNLVAGDAISNKASIYFDYNLPVQTNTEKTVVANDVILPLQLISFSANHNGKTNLLKWSTEQELNTDRFEIQRSNNSRDFVNIGTVRSLNNGKAKNDYVFTDVQPSNAINYYRLKLIDKDGGFTYSAIKNVINSNSLHVAIYPNPVHQNLTLTFNTEKPVDMHIEIVNTEGKKVYTSKMHLAYGNSLQFINTVAFPAGNYFVKCITADGQIGLKFVKQ